MHTLKYTHVGSTQYMLHNLILHLSYCLVVDMPTCLYTLLCICLFGHISHTYFYKKAALFAVLILSLLFVIFVICSLAQWHRHFFTSLHILYVYVAIKLIES